MHHTNDPGWGRPLETALVALLPAVGLKRMAKGNLLVGLRTMIVAYLGLLVLIGGVAVLLDVAVDEFGADVDPATASFGVFFLGALLIPISTMLGRTLPCGSPRELAAAYQRRFFLRLALASACALAGFVAVTLSSSAVPYPFGAVWAATGYLAMAPTQGRIAGQQARLRSAGCRIDLFDSLNIDAPSLSTDPPD